MGYPAGLHFTYPKDKKAALRAADPLAEQQISGSDSEYSFTSLREHPDDVVSLLVLASCRVSALF